MILNSTAEGLDPNPILVAFREGVYPIINDEPPVGVQAAHMLEAMELWQRISADPEHIDHARRVLTLLANWQES